MRKDIGNKVFSIWLLGDSNPKNWHSTLESPFDPRHPARHSIWTPVIDMVQDQIFRELQNRIDTSQLYIRNAIENPSKKPKQTEKEWPTEVTNEISELQYLITNYQPKFLFSFGAFSFEFGRRALNEDVKRSHGYWGARNLGLEFRERISNFNTSSTNLLPLLHVSIARGKFLQSHEYFCDMVGANYFEFVGKAIATQIIIRHKDLDIWIE